MNVCLRAKPGLRGMPGTSRSGAGRSAGAFTLPEVMVAVMIIGVTMLALFAGFRQSFGVVATNRENVRATQILEEKLEVIRLFDWDEVTTAGFIPTSFTEYFDPTVVTNNAGVFYVGTVTLTNIPTSEAYAANMRMVSINLAWTNNGEAHTRGMTSFIARYGMQNYIY